MDNYARGFTRSLTGSGRRENPQWLSESQRAGGASADNQCKKQEALEQEGSGCRVSPGSKVWKLPGALPA